MSADSSTKLQVNFRMGQSLINVYGESEDDLELQLDALGRRGGQIAEVDALLQAAARAAGLLATQNQPQSASQAPSQAPAASGGAGAPTPFCDHGNPRERRVAKDGSWGGWFCTMPKGQDCKPIWDSKKGR